MVDLNEPFRLDDEEETSERSTPSPVRAATPDDAADLDLDLHESGPDNHASPMEPLGPSPEDVAARKRQMMGKVGAMVFGVLGVGVLGLVAYSKFAASPAPAPMVATPLPAPVVEQESVATIGGGGQAQAITGTLMGQQESGVQSSQSAGGFEPDPAQQAAQGVGAGTPMTPVEQQPSPSFAAPLAAVGTAEPVLAAAPVCEDTVPLKAEVESLKRQLAKSEAIVKTLQSAKPGAPVQAHASPSTTVAKAAPGKKGVLSEYSTRVARTGQAWIDVGNQQVAVVQVGDRLPNGARVLEIGAETGRIETTMGAILP